MADNGFRPAPRPKIALDNPKLSMFAQNSAGKMARLNWGLVDNNPRITVYTNDPNDQGNQNGRISAHLDAPTMFAVFELLKYVINVKGPYKDKVDCLNYTFPNGKRSEKPSVTASVIVGKDESGTIWISLSGYQRPQIQFKFMNPDFHHFIHGDGSHYTHAEISETYAKAYVNLLERMYAHMLVTEFKEIERKPNNNGGGGNFNRNNNGGGNNNGGYNKGGQQNGGYKRQPDNIPSGTTEDSDDIPW